MKLEEPVILATREDYYAFFAQLGSHERKIEVAGAFVMLDAHLTRECIQGTKPQNN